MRRLAALSPRLPRPRTLLLSFISGTRLIERKVAQNFRYLDYREGACLRCNHPIRDGACAKHGVVDADGRPR